MADLRDDDRDAVVASRTSSSKRGTFRAVGQKFGRDFDVVWFQKNVRHD